MLHFYYYNLLLFLVPSLWCAQALSPLVDGGCGGCGKEGASHRQSRRFPHHNVVISTHLYSMNIEQQPKSVPIIEQRSSIIPLLELEDAVVDETAAAALFELEEESPPPTTETQYQQSNTGMDSPRPKIVIFGPSGRTGRRILCKLLNSGANVDIVAYTRDPIKLEQVLYNNEDLVLGNYVINNNRISNDRGGDQSNSRNGSGPTLRVVVGDVVSSRQNYQKMKIKDTKLRGLQFVMSLFLGRSTYNNTTTSMGTIENGDNASLLANNDFSTKDDDDDDDAILQDAISGATVLISCLGTRRRTNVWTDFLRVPILRIVRANNVDKWCSDMTHPYYINYITTKRILEVAEREQRKREVSIELERERLMLDEQWNQLRKKEEEEKDDAEEGFESEIAAGLRKKRQHELYEQHQREKRPMYSSQDRRNVVTMPQGGKLLSTSDRIKFIRISHAMVGRNPFRLRNVLNNILWSQVSRYERMGEMVLEESALVDTIVLRPGDMTDEERNINTTSLQLCVDGVVPSPSIVGREDVADIAAILALTKTSSSSATVPEYNYDNNMKFPPPMRLAHHWTWAMRWTGQYISPPQGLRPDGQPNAATCFVLSIKEQIERDRKRKLRMDIMKTYHGGKEVLRLKRWSRRSLSPHMQSLAILLPVYLMLGIISTYLFRPTFIELYSRLSRGTIHQTLMKLLS
jgi:hypothetical protein